MVHRRIHRLPQAGHEDGADTRCASAVAKVTAPVVAERNDNHRRGGSQECDFGHPDGSRTSNNSYELDQ
jgi:hypothetical protein